jgi:dGTP triphosphohydrolase
MTNQNESLTVLKTTFNCIQRSIDEDKIQFFYYLTNIKSKMWAYKQYIEKFFPSFILIESKLRNGSIKGYAILKDIYEKYK